MKLFFIVENDEPHAAGGGFYALFKFAEFLALRGHKISIYAVHDKGWISAGENISLHFRPHFPRRGRFLTKCDRWLSRVCETFQLRSAIKRMQPDWILGVLTYSAIKAEILGRHFKIPVANFIYECPPWMKEIWGEATFKRGFDTYTQSLWEHTRQAYLGSQILFPNSELSRKYNEQWLNGKKIAEPIYPGIDPQQMPYQSIVTESLPLNKTRKQLLFVGRLVDSKNIPHLIKAFLELQQNADLHICGTGADMAALKNLAQASPHIYFHGYVTDNDLWSLFRQCDLVIYPTGFEGFGMPPMQALYFGKPCIASDLAVFKSIYGDLLEYFPLGNIPALTQSIDTLLNDPQYCQRRGEAGRRYVLENFTWSRAAERIEHQLLKVHS